MPGKPKYHWKDWEFADKLKPIKGYEAKTQKISSAQLLQIIANKPGIFNKELADLFDVSPVLIGRRLEEIKKYAETDELTADVLRKHQKEVKKRLGKKRKERPKDKKEKKITEKMFVEYLIKNLGRSNQDIANDFNVSNPVITRKFKKLIKKVEDEKEDWYYIKKLLVKFWEKSRRRHKVYYTWKKEIDNSV